MEYAYPLLYVGIVGAVSIFLEMKGASDVEKPTAAAELRGTDSELFEIDQKIKQFSQEAERINHPDTFVEYSKLKRAILKLEKDRESLKVKAASQEEALGGATKARDEVIKDKIKDIKKNATRNKMLVALVLTFVLDRLVHFDIDADQLFPLEYLIGKKENDGRYSFRPTFLFAFLTVRFSNRIQAAGEYFVEIISGKSASK